MSINMFLRLDNVTGESKDMNHKGWTDVISFNWGAVQPNNMSVGGGGGTGKVCFNDLCVEALIDKSTPTILKLCSTGKHIGTVEMSVCKAGGSQIEYARIILSDVLVTAVIFSGSNPDDTVGVRYTFQGSVVKQKYWEQTQQGGKGAESAMGWSIKENREV